MKKLKFETYFREQLEAFLNENSAGKTAVFFRGFGSAQNREILSRSDALLTDGTLGRDGALNLSAVDARKAEIAEKLVSGSFHIGLYEQLFAALAAVPDLLNRCGGKIVIAENNLFSGYYPAAVPKDAAKALYEYFQDERAGEPEGLSVYLRYYSDVSSPDETHMFLAPMSRSTLEKVPIIPFFQEEKAIVAAPDQKGTVISISGRRFPAWKADLLADCFPEGGTIFTVDARSDPKRYAFPAFAGILNHLGIRYGVRTIHRFNVTEKGSEDRFLPLLREHWGKDASFRRLCFYRTPDSSRSTEEISQGAIISQIAAQCEDAFSGKGYHDIFITAPTGAGKSLLFQLPAIHLAEKFGAVTIVISPLIALMKDQVTQLAEERGVTSATFINSTLTYEERETQLRAIRSGEKSIVYLAPELLVSMPLDSVTGGRPVGLFVIDEAHIVTSWGKDFRADYWYLGDFLNRIRRKGMRFPVLCLTATAVYGGAEDVVNETAESLFLSDPLLYLGSVRRENIRFDIHHADPKNTSGTLETFKVKKACEAVKGYVEKNEKALVYCPFVTQVDDIYTALDDKVKLKVRKYYGTLNKETRNSAQDSFRSGKCSVMVCTKAFGMGIDVRDISDVYHYAPTGSLADYVQEIGRAAREEGSQGCASADFLPTDIRYVRTLNSISEMKQYQLREMLRKINTLCQERNSHSLFLSPDAFAYLFGNRELENRVKNGLLLISKDLESRFGYPVITVRPRAMLTRAYGNVPLSVAEGFERKYGSAVKKREDRTKRILFSHNKRYESDTKVFNSGKIYEIDMPAVWKEHFRDMSFSQFNHRFFSGELFHGPAGEIFSPRILVWVSYLLPFPEMLEKLKQICLSLSDIFREFRASGGTFTAGDFKDALTARFGEGMLRLEFSGLLLDQFVADLSRNVGFRTNRDRMKFIASRKAPSGELCYRVLNTGYIAMPAYIGQLAAQCPPDEENIYRAFIPLGRNGHQPERLRLFSMLELLGLASCQMEGSQNMEVFVRVNDPETLLSLTEEGYSNAVLTDLRRRHRSAQETMMGFMARDFTTAERWDVIEDYFLGREDEVQKALQLPKAAK